MKSMRNVWRRELVTLGRDWREYAIAVGFTATLALIIGGLEIYFLGNVKRPERTTIRFAAQGVALATEHFKATLAAFEIELYPYEGDLAAAVASGREGYGVVVPADLARAEREGGAAEVEVLLNSSVRSFFAGNQLSLDRLKLALHEYRRSLLGQRLGWPDPSDARLRPVALSIEDVTPPVVGRGLGALFVKLLLAFLLPVSGAYLVDMIAGENKNATLEALLTTPAGEWSIVFGKLLAGYVVTLLIAGSTVAGVWAAILALPDWLLLGTRFSWASAAMVMLVTVPAGYFLCAVQFSLGALVTRYDKSQTAVAVTGASLLVLSIVVSSLVSIPQALYLVPVLGSFELVDVWMTTGGLPAGALLLTLIGGIGWGTLIVGVFGARLFDRERMLYGG